MTKDEFEARLRAIVLPDRGDEANGLTEADFVNDLAEDGWPDHAKWLEIWCRLNNGGALTERERESAMAYWFAEDIADVPSELRLP